mgnify:CR=1 FL=1
MATLAAIRLSTRPPSVLALVDLMMALIERNASDPPCIALFLCPELTTETLMPSRKTQIYPLSTPWQDSLPVSAHQPAVACEQSLQADDYLFISRDNPLTIIQRSVLGKLFENMWSQYADSTQYVYAIRLTTP